ncbi:non-ribosomal peptide synthetase [Mycolicibacterium arenosum]|uniref:Phenyloxazoline synthase MbtB n=1 Tax=Mycolicibacterium arenosum TaxID=2952157 RepID=A0ABT1MG02_9MYCO|nr:amino acid adenylation domain-containing protein [Mycolicibacterium sp. CAU 1645]MCP9276687.1 amino acid adenylation domain-containing protein [Mycolicibacterium sp. CAU 1645]
MGVGTGPETVRDEVAELLGVSADAVDPDADLIACGLDSIRMMSLSGRWRKQGINVGFAALAANPTVTAWADLVAEHAGAPIAETERVAEPDETGDPGAPFPLAPIQHAMWVGRHGEQELGGVAAHLYVEFDGAGVDPERLRDAAAKLAARHPMLRQEILPDGTQRISDRDLPVTVYDLRELDRAGAADRLERTRDAKSHQLLDGEVLQLSLSLLPDGRTRLHVDMDMQAADAVSYRNFMADLAAFYRGAELPELGYTYREYRATLAANTPPPSQEDLQWWAERVPDLPEPPALPLVPRSDQRNPLRTVRLWHVFDVETRDALFAAAHQRGITPAMAVAATYANALARWSTNSRFLLNLPMFGREPYHPDVDKLVGDFTSSLMLDIDLTNAATAAQRARVVQEVLHATATHSSVSGLNVLRDLSRHRGAQTLATIVYTSALGLGDLFAGDVTDQFGEPVWTISQGPQVLIDAQATPLANGLMINWDVRVEAFPPGVPEAMFAYQLDELERLATDDASWDAVDPPALSAESRAVRAAANATGFTASGDNLVDGFHRNAAATPHATAVIGSTETLTYAQLQQKALAVAAALQSRGVHAGDVVAIMGPKNTEQIPALLGILTAGAAYLPIGVDQPAERATRILETGGVEFALVTGSEMPGVLDSAGVPALTVADAEIIGDPAHFERPAVDPQQLAYVLFTSGSTGEPKGVELKHDAVLNTLEFLYRHFDIGASDRGLALSHLESDMSVPDVFGTLRVGGAIVVVDEEHRRDPDVWARLIDAHGVTVVNFLPGWLEMLTEVGESAGRSLRSLRVILTGGDWVRPAMARAMRERAPGARFAGLGGATETAIHGTLFEVTGDIPEVWPSVPYGLPFPNIACRVVSDGGEDCPDWVPGELWFSGRGIARGYRGRPDLTAEKFVEFDGRVWYRSGDLARYRPDGTLEFVGRSDHRVKLSGYRIELGEVEAVLRRVPGVESAVAAVVPFEGGRDVLGALIRTDDASVDAAAVAAAMADLVPPHMIPTVFAVTDRIPFRNGKIDRRAALHRLAQAELPAGRGQRVPATALEKALAAILGDVLGRNDIGADDDFFALGGDSVMATTAVARVRDWLDTPTVMVPDVFAARTVEELARRLVGREAGSDRLEQVADLYLEISGMDGADVEAELERADAR